MWTFISPQLTVPDVVEAQHYYRDVLLFKVAWLNDERDYGAVYSGTTEIFLTTNGSETRGATYCVRVQDVDAIHAAYRDSGAEFTEALETRSWGMREFGIVDPWGHRFRIGQSTVV